MKKLSTYKFANAKIERMFVKFWICLPKEEIDNFKKTLEVIPNF